MKRGNRSADCGRILQQQSRHSDRIPNPKKILKTPIGDYGGKPNSLKHILPLIPEHRAYTEPFCGGCAVLFAKVPGKCEVINDVHAESINFYPVAKTRYTALKERIDPILHRREIYVHARQINDTPYFFSCWTRAGPFGSVRKQGLLRNRTAFQLRSYGCHDKKFDHAKDIFTQTPYNRLDHVIPEGANGSQTISRYEFETAFHFIDPPYIGTDCGHYAGEFNDQNFYVS